MARHSLCCFLIALSSCHFRTEVTQIHDLKNLTGVWYATPDTYSMLERKKYKVASLSLRLYAADSVFEGTNFPDNITSQSGEPVNGIYGNATGVWQVYNFRDDWKVHLQFTKGPVFTEKTSLDFEIYLEDSTLVLCTYLGDPDSGDILEYQKSR
jgi:hypothetical protein